ncbi:Protein MOR1 [Camellia lanceoleosa]|uniref:Protein MOR1 n=1 Tax=Camellia lanceoleosa TaxID=1840588 RepID=A0ACC0HT24_9ERIC|nr:Protein MOR1 [Camellia lanceoleosa]
MSSGAGMAFAFPVPCVEDNEVCQNAIANRMAPSIAPRMPMYPSARVLDNNYFLGKLPLLLFLPRKAKSKLFTLTLMFLMDAKLGMEGRKDLFDWLSRKLSGLSNFPDARAVQLMHVLLCFKFLAAAVPFAALRPLTGKINLLLQGF